MNLNNKVAFITGSSKNIGRAFAEELAKEGAKIVIHYHSDNSRAAAEAAAASIPTETLIVKGDLSKPNTIKDIFKQILSHFGRLDIVINNAGDLLKKSFIDINEQEYDRIFGINSKAAFFIMQEAAKSISDNGRIINIGTSLLAATTGLFSVYAGSKASLEHFSRALAHEIGHRGITVNTVAPGPIDTDFFHGQETPEAAAKFANMVPAKRLGTVQDVVSVVKFLVSDEAKWINGQTIFVNGAFVAR